MRIFTFSPAVRISIGLVCFVISVLLVSDLIGILPQKKEMLLDARKTMSESLAVQFSLAATRGDVDFLNATLEHFVSRNADVLGASLQRHNGEVIAEYGTFREFNHDTDPKDLSSPNLVFVPIFAGENRWGRVNVEYASILAGGWHSLLTETIFGLLTFVAVISLLGYIFILKKTLHVLDPKAVVPERVRTALNTLAEGVLILDDKEQIMMANNAFAGKINRHADKLIGVKASDLKWKLHKIENESELPWRNSIASGVKKTGIHLNLSTPRQGVRSMSANSAPILDDKGKTRGALVTFDDITDVEETNILLKSAVDTLKKNDDEIRRKNRELQVLASRDPLTGCFNRRAFFDILEDMYERAIGRNRDLACLMVDIDHFKSINDVYGHAVGDEVIRMVSEILNACPYEGAVIGRYGGEEFCVVLPDADIASARQIAELIRNNIKESSAKFQEIRKTITASFGVACLDTAMESFSVLLEQADTALYAAKNSGRDRVVTWVEHSSLETGMNAGTMQRDHATGKAGAPEQEEPGRNRSNIQLRLLNKRVRELEQELENAAAKQEIERFRDPVTELPSRIIFEDRVSQSIAYSDRTANLMAVAILNIDMFSRINNSLGQVVGDEFLKAVGRRLQTILRRSDTVASITSPGQTAPSLSRLHDDEFALLLNGLDTVESLTYVIKRIQEKFSGMVDIGENQIYVTTTIGMSLYPHDGRDARQLIDNARSAQKHARGRPGRNKYQFFSREINEKVITQMKLELDIHKAVERGEFIIHYQPKFNINRARVDSMEALVRWNHPEHGIIAPDGFIAEAEKSGHIIDIGSWCLQNVCAQLKQWLVMGADNIRASVNISAFEFADENFVDKVRFVLKKNELSARHLELEITESTVMGDTDLSARIIEELRFMGVTVTLDDFGTGYSSFHYLGHLDFDWIKIDKYFLDLAMKNERSKTLYNGIITMAHEIGLRVVAEGIENEEEYNFVNRLGVDEMQGYLLCKPLSAHAVQQLLMPAALPENTAAG